MYFLNNYFARSGIRGMKRRHYEKKDKALIEANKSARILVILHLFYPQSWKEIREYEPFQVEGFTVTAFCKGQARLRRHKVA